MQNVSKVYKQSMKAIGRNRGYIRATLGIINSEAQKNVEVNEQTSVTYFSDITKPFNAYAVDKVYTTAEQDFSKVDGSMYFLPKQSSGLDYYNSGIATSGLLGAIYISFHGVLGLDIKGLTIDFGECYPVDFSVENEGITRYYKGNDKRYWVTEDVFDGTSYLIIKPSKMVNGQGRFRIYQFSCGIVNSFSNKETKKFTLKEYTSSITDSIPSVDMSLTVDNQDLYYSPDNPESTLAYFEVGQEMKVAFGYDVTGNGDIEWLPEQTAYLKTWSASDTEAKFTATDRFDYLTDKYYKGLYRENGISLYDLAIDVLHDAGITDDRYYFVDPYLKDIVVRNPMPAVKHSEALQIIANAGRCCLYEDRDRRIHLKASFIPDMEASCNGETEFSHIENVLNDDTKDAYAIASNDFSVVDGSVFFLPKNRNYLNTGYISTAIWHENPEGTIASRLPLRLGGFQPKYKSSYGFWNGETPKITIELEAAFVAYGLVIRFRNTAPQEFVVKTYNYGEFVEEKTFQNEELEFITREQFDLFDKMEIEFTRGYPDARIVIDNIIVGDVTDYVISRNDLSASPTATRQNKVKSISVTRNIYKESAEEIKDISSSDIIISPDDNTYTVYFSKPCYGLEASIDAGTDEEGNALPSDISVEITDNSSYFATLRFSGMDNEQTVKYVIKGYEYVVEEIGLVKKHNDNGEEITWSNPLISDVQHAKDMEEWLASYYLGDVDYQIKWRGDPRTDANDLFYLELKDRPQTMIRCYQNELSFSGAWSGTMKARKAVL